MPCLETTQKLWTKLKAQDTYVSRQDICMAAVNPHNTHILNKPIILYFSMIRGILRSKWIITSRVFSSVVLQRKCLKNMALTSDKIQNSSLCFSNNREKSFTSSEQSALCRHHILCFCYKFFVVHFNSNFLAERFSFQQTRGNKLNLNSPCIRQSLTQTVFSITSTE